LLRRASPLIACAALLAGCGSATHRRALPDGWKRIEARSGGFSFGLPPEWTARGRRGAVLLRAPGRRAVVSVSADRTSLGRRVPPKTYVVRLLRALRVSRAPRTGPLPHAGYPGVCVGTHGLEICAVHEPRAATFSLVGFGHRRRLRTDERRVIVSVARTLHDERRPR
jgi:hypothetical protein